MQKKVMFKNSHAEAKDVHHQTSFFKSRLKNANSKARFVYIDFFIHPYLCVYRVRLCTYQEEQFMCTPAIMLSIKDAKWTAEMLITATVVC